MAKELAIKIKFSSDGQEKIIKNIAELEKEIESLSQEIKTLDFGSAEYEQAANNLAKLKAGLRDVDKEIEGLDKEQRLTALAGATELVAGSFLIASSAARTFGASAESVEEIEELERKALEAVNIALGVRAVAEGLVQVAQLKRLATETAANIQTKIATGLQTAYAAVVGASTGALKLFRIALISTGIGAAIVAIGLLIANWDKLTKAIGFSSKELDDYTKTNIEAQKQTALARVQLDFYARVVNNVNKSEAERLQALDELNKLGVITEDITLDQADALDILNERLELARDNILLKAQAEAASQLLTEAIKADIEAQNSTLEDNLSWWEKAGFAIAKYTTLLGYATVDAAAAQRALENQAETLEETGAAVSRYESLYLNLLEQLNENEAKLRGEREKASKNRKEDDKQKEKTLDLDAELNKIQQQRIELLKKVRRETELLATAERDEVAIIEEANKIIEDQNKLLEERLGILGTTQGEAEDFYDSLTRLLGGVQIPQDVVTLRDTFNELFELIKQEGKLFTGLTDVASSSAIQYLKAVQDGYKGTFEEFEKTFVAIEDLNEEQRTFNILLRELDKIDPKLLDEEQIQILIDFFDTQVRINQVAKDYNDITQETINKIKESEDEFLKTIQRQKESGEITEEQYKKYLDIVNLQREGVDLSEKLLSENVDYNRLLNDIVEIQNNAVKDGLSTLATQEKITSLVAERLFDETNLNNLTSEQLALVDKITQSLLDQSKIYKQVEDVAKQIEDLNVKILEGIDKQSQKLSDAQFQQLQEFVKANKDKIDEIEKFFATATEETTNLTQEQIDAINKLIDGVKFDSLIEGIADVTNEIVGVFNDVTGQIQGVISDSISLQLEQLDYYGEQALAQVGDETERQKALQEEIRKDIEKERFELNKRGRISELRFAQAQAVANGAQAVVNAIANVTPPFGQILAGIYAGITAAQVTIIRDQLSFVQGTQFQARRGGLVMGASHEMGGVPMGNGLELEGGEAIINRNAVSQFSDLLSQINLSTGGRAIQSNDSEIAQEIRRQNQTPIKTYVLYNDIQDTNKINSKLEQISRL